jgi:hypothetical protein
MFSTTQLIILVYAIGLLSGIAMSFGLTELIMRYHNRNGGGAK